MGGRASVLARPPSTAKGHEPSGAHSAQYGLLDTAPRRAGPCAIHPWSAEAERSPQLQARPGVAFAVPRTRARCPPPPSRAGRKRRPKSKSSAQNKSSIAAAAVTAAFFSEQRAYAYWVAVGAPSAWHPIPSFLPRPPHPGKAPAPLHSTLHPSSRRSRYDVCTAPPPRSNPRCGAPAARSSARRCSRRSWPRLRPRRSRQVNHSPSVLARYRFQSVCSSPV
jgi:hypothetical protein